MKRDDLYLENRNASAGHSLSNIKIRPFEINFRPRCVFINSKNTTLNEFAQSKDINGGQTPLVNNPE